MNKKTQKNLIYLLIPTTIVIIVWIGVSIYTRAVSSTISQKLKVSIQEIDSKFDTSIIESLKKRGQVDGKIDIDPQALATPSATPTNTPTPTSNAASAESSSASQAAAGGNP